MPACGAYNDAGWVYLIRISYLTGTSCQVYYFVDCQLFLLFMQLSFFAPRKSEVE